MTRFLCFVLFLLVIALGSALYVQSGGSLPIADLVAYAEARAQTFAGGPPDADARDERGLAPRYEEPYSRGPADVGPTNWGALSATDVGDPDAAGERFSSDESGHYANWGSSETPATSAVEFEAGKILARVGSEVIIAGDVIPVVNHVFQQHKAEIDQMSPDDVDKLRRRMIKNYTLAMVPAKLLYDEAKKEIPAENFTGILEQIEEQFDEHQVPGMYKKLKVETRPQLEAKLRELGTSMDHEKRMFIDSAIAEQWMRMRAIKDREVTHTDLVDYYRDHIAEFQFASKARWEHLFVGFASHGSQAEAYARLANMGNAVIDGVPWSEVARDSDDKVADESGVRDWTTQGTLVSETIDKTLFELPVGTLSPILEDEQGFHILRIIERREAGTTPFTEVQAEIQEKIKKQRQAEQKEAYLARLRQATPVWTVFDDDPPEPEGP